VWRGAPGVRFPTTAGDEKEGELSVASSRERQRKLAREKLDRQMARRAGRVRRRRQIQAGVGAAVALLLIVAGGLWIGGVFDSDPATDPTAAEDCAWTPLSTANNANLKDVGTPPKTGIPQEGTRPMTLTTNQGAPIVASLDLAAAPCGAANIAYLAGKNFYDNTDCHEITTEGALRCGDPSGTGEGGPTYSIYSENTPASPDPAPSASAAPAAGQPPLYPKGTVALIGNPPGSNGSQFLIFFKDFSPAQPTYSIIGTVTGGLDTLTKISKLPTVDNGAGAKVKPKDKITVQSLTVGEVATSSEAAPSVAPSASAQS
jgi:peptidyl-prolyl cis-trans isomerase B (cyclophilin B)